MRRAWDAGDGAPTESIAWPRPTHANGLHGWSVIAARYRMSASPGFPAISEVSPASTGAVEVSRTARCARHDDGTGDGGSFRSRPAPGTITAPLAPGTGVAGTARITR